MSEKLSSLKSEAFDASVKRPSNESAETLAPWSSRWSKSKIGWHKHEIHHFLEKYGHFIAPGFPMKNDSSCLEGEKPGNKILLPLCGKSVDMAHLANHDYVDEVVGIDGVKRALEEFIAENPMLDIVEGDINGSVETYRGKNIKLLRGDFFQIDEDDTEGKFDSIFDRASIVAIRPELRRNYVETIGKLIKPGGSILLVTVDRRDGTDTAMKAGPPFSVNENDVRVLYESQSWVESVTKLEEIDEFENDPGSKARWESMGLKSLYELCFLIKVKE